MTLYKWSQTASADATADSTINWQEGQAPSSVNDSARGMMAAVAKYRDDVSGMVLTTGTSTAYVVASNQGFDSLADMALKIVGFTPHATCGDTVTLNVDSLGAKPLRSSPGVEIPAGTLILGTPYLALYNNTDGAFYLQGFYNAYNVPFLGGMDYWDTVTPNSAFIFPAGQAISRSVYAKAFARWGTKFGAGDGSTTFNVPDKTGRGSVMMEATATRLTSAYFGGDSTALGAVGGGESDTLVSGNMPSQSVSVSGIVTVSSGAANLPSTTGSWNNRVTGTGGDAYPNPSAAIGNLNSMSGSNTMTGTVGNASPTPIRTVQPTIVCNYIIRIL